MQTYTNKYKQMILLIFNFYKVRFTGSHIGENSARSSRCTREITNIDTNSKDRNGGKAYTGKTDDDGRRWAKKEK